MTPELFERRVAALAQLRVADPARPVLAAPDEHHLRRVLRARVGEEVVVTDGRGAWAICAVAESGLEPLTAPALDPAPPESVLYLAPPRGDRADWAIAKATEVGVSRVVPLVAANLAWRFAGETRAKVLARWRRVADPARPVLAPPDEHHLRRVLRARVGEEVVVTDGRGAWAICAVAEAGLEPLTGPALDPAPPESVLYLAPPRGERADWAIAKATEVGVSRVVPLVTANLAWRFSGEARAKVLARWRRVAAEAAGQCRRTHDLVIDEPTTPAAVPGDVAVCELTGSASRDWRGVRAVAVGPEGGWAPGEWGDERRRLSLGDTVLRSETAAVLAGALCVLAGASPGFSLGTKEAG